MVTSKYWPSPYSLSASVEFPLLLNTQHHWYHTLWNKLRDKRETSTQSFTINTMILPYNHPAIWLGYYDWKIHFFSSFCGSKFYEIHIFIILSSRIYMYNVLQNNLMSHQLPVGLLFQFVRALHWYHRGQGSLIPASLFFRLSFCNCISCIRWFSLHISSFWGSIKFIDSSFQTARVKIIQFKQWKLL